MFHGWLYSDSSIAEGLNSVIGTSEDWDPVNTALLWRAFKNQFAGSGGHYILKCSKLLGYVPASNYLYVLFHGKNNRELAIGRFKNKEAGDKAVGSIHEWCVIPAADRDELVQHLAARKEETNRKSGAEKVKSKKRRNSRHNVTPNLGTPSSQLKSGVQLSPPRKKQASTMNKDGERLIEAFTESEKKLPREPNVHYHLFGRAGKMYVGAEDSVTVEELINNLEPAAESETDSNWQHRVKQGQ